MTQARPVDGRIVPRDDRPVRITVQRRRTRDPPLGGVDPADCCSGAARPGLSATWVATSRPAGSSGEQRRSLERQAWQGPSSGGLPSTTLRRHSCHVRQPGAPPSLAAPGDPLQSHARSIGRPGYRPRFRRPRQPDPCPLPAGGSAPGPRPLDPVDHVEHGRPAAERQHEREEEVQIEVARCASP